MHVAKITTRRQDRVYESYLIRQSYREDGKVKHRQIANISALPLPVIYAVRSMLRGEPVGPLTESFQILRSLPHGAVLAVLGEIRKLGLDKLIAARPRRERELALAMIVSRILEPASKLATVRSWEDTTLASVLGVENADEDDLYWAMDWLLEQQPKIEAKLAQRHLEEGVLVLYDLTSVYLEGSKCELAKHGYSRDGKKGLLQIEFGLLTDKEGRPVAVEVFEGNTSDPNTVAAQVEKLQQRFGIRQVVLVGDRGMLTSARIEALQKVGGLSWVSALRSPQIAALVKDGDLQLGLFDERNLVEIASERFPGERLVVCRNPILAEERARKREELLRATERELDKVVASGRAGRLGSADRIGLRVGRISARFKVGKHFRLEIGEGSFSYQRDQQHIDAEVVLDGLYVVRSNVSREEMSSPELVRSYKLLEHAERAFRTLKSIDLQVRPVHHRLADRVRAHVFLCMLAYYVRWHLERAWAPLLFRDEAKPVAEDVVVPAQRSAGALAKVHSQHLPDGSRVHSFHSLLKNLGTLTRNTVRVPGSEATFEKLAQPTALQERAFQLLGLKVSV